MCTRPSLPSRPTTAAAHPCHAQHSADKLKCMTADVRRGCIAEGASIRGQERIGACIACSDLYIEFRGARVRGEAGPKMHSDDLPQAATINASLPLKPIFLFGDIGTYVSPLVLNGVWSASATVILWFPFSQSHPKSSHWHPLQPPSSTMCA